MTRDEIIILAEQWRYGNISADDARLLMDSITKGEHRELLEDLFEGHLRANEFQDLLPVIGHETGFRKLSGQITSVTHRTVHRVHFLKTAWLRYAAAIILIFGIGVYLWNTAQKKNQQITETKPVPVKNDIQPGKNRALLTLSNGQQVMLDSAASATIHDGTLSIENNNGQLIYMKGDHFAINTMSTPKGGQYQLILADGTKVWLNAASSVTYPTAFAGASREVSITGEVYFEVAKDKTKPFYVKTTGATISVLGTSFNVNAYNDEPAMKTSLLEGMVKVNDAVLRPGEAYVNGKVVTTNLDQDIAWKNGAFNFQDMDLNAAFRLLGRWYNVEIKYASAVPKKEIRGKMGRDLSLSEVLNALDELGIHTKIKGSTLVVLPE